jgi:hypothetical protein
MARTRATQTTKKSVQVTLGSPQEKKSVVRYDSPEEDGALSTVYVRKEALKGLGNPDKIKITIEPA